MYTNMHYVHVQIQMYASTCTDKFTQERCMYVEMLICIPANRYMCITTRTCTHVYAYIVYTNMYTCIHVYMYVYVHTYMRIHVYRYVGIYAFLYLCKHEVVSAPTQMCTCTCARTCVCKGTCIRTCICICTFMCLRRCSCRRFCTCPFTFVCLGVCVRTCVYTYTYT